MLVCDLDGTLLTSKGTMTDATVNALHQAVAAGVEVAFATGRRHTFAWDVLAPVGLHPDTVLISSNGALTRTFAGELLHRIGMPTETALLLCRQLTRFRSSLVFTFERTGLGALIVEDLETLHRSIARWVESNRHEIEQMVPLERAFEDGEEPVQAMICGTMHRSGRGHGSSGGNDSGGFGFTTEAIHPSHGVCFAGPVYCGLDASGLFEGKCHRATGDATGN